MRPPTGRRAAARRARPQKPRRAASPSPLLHCPRPSVRPSLSVVGGEQNTRDGKILHPVAVRHGRARHRPARRVHAALSRARARRAVDRRMASAWPLEISGRGIGQGEEGGLGGERNARLASGSGVGSTAATERRRARAPPFKIERLGRHALRGARAGGRADGRAGGRAGGRSGWADGRAIDECGRRDVEQRGAEEKKTKKGCLLYTSPSPRD